MDSPLSILLSTLKVRYIFRGYRFIRDANSRQKYHEGVAQSEREIIGEVKGGTISIDDGVSATVEARNNNLTMFREHTSPLGQLVCRVAKPYGRRRESLLDKYAKKEFRKEFASLSPDEASIAKAMVMEASGRSNAGWDTTMKLVPVLSTSLGVRGVMEIISWVTSGRLSSCGWGGNELGWVSIRSCWWSYRGVAGGLIGTLIDREVAKRLIMMYE